MGGWINEKRLGREKVTKRQAEGMKRIRKGLTEISKKKGGLISRGS